MAVSGWGIKDPRWERVAAATGVVFAILAFVAFIIEPNPASPGDSSEEILSFFTETPRSSGKGCCPRPPPP